MFGVRLDTFWYAEIRRKRGLANAVRVRSSTVELFPNIKDLALRLDNEIVVVRQTTFPFRAGM